MCSVTNTAALSVAGKPTTIVRIASTPPAEAPITMIGIGSRRFEFIVISIHDGNARSVPKTPAFAASRQGPSAQAGPPPELRSLSGAAQPSASFSKSAPRATLLKCVRSVQRRPFSRDVARESKILPDRQPECYKPVRLVLNDGHTQQCRSTQHDRGWRLHRLCPCINRGSEPRRPDRRVQSRRVSPDIFRTCQWRKIRRPELTQALKALRKSDSFVVWRLDRLRRSLPHAITAVAELARDGIGFESIDERIDTASTGGTLIFHIFASLA